MELSTNIKESLETFLLCLRMLKTRIGKQYIIKIVWIEMNTGMFRFPVPLNGIHIFPKFIPK